MYHVEIYAQVCRFCIAEGNSSRHAGRVFGLSRATVRKILSYAEPPGYRRREPVKRPVLGLYVGIIDHILESDTSRPKKQRHTAHRFLASTTPAMTLAEFLAKQNPDYPLIAE